MSEAGQMDRIMKELRSAVNDFEYHFNTVQNRHQWYEQILRDRIQELDQLDLQQLITNINYAEVKYQNDDAGLVLVELRKEDWDRVNEAFLLLLTPKSDEPLSDVYEEARYGFTSCSVCDDSDHTDHMHVVCNYCKESADRYTNPEKYPDER